MKGKSNEDRASDDRQRYDMSMLVRRRQSHLLTATFIVGIVYLLLAQAAMRFGIHETLRGPGLVISILLICIGIVLLLTIFAAMWGRCLNAKIDRIVMESLSRGDPMALHYWVTAWNAVKPSTRQHARPYILEILRKREAMVSESPEPLCNILVCEMINAWFSPAFSADYLRVIKDYLMNCASDEQLLSVASLVRQKPHNAHQAVIRDIFGDLIATYPAISRNDQMRRTLLRPKTTVPNTLLRPISDDASQLAAKEELLRLVPPNSRCTDQDQTQDFDTALFKALSGRMTATVGALRARRPTKVRRLPSMPKTG